MDADHRRSRKRRRVDTPEIAVERPAATATTAAKEMAAAPVPLPAVGAMMEDLRSNITCKVCFRLLYEPFTIACGHTYCYSCLNEWFDRNEDRRKTCPDCRAVVKQPPAPAYTIKGITQIYLQHPEHLPEGETKEQHEEQAAQEQAIVDVDKSNTEAGGLFKGVFDREFRPAPILDDGIERCPFCTWELEPGDGPLCPHCGHEHDAGSDEVSESGTVTSTSEGGGRHHDHLGLDEEVDEDDMYDDEVFAALQHGPLGLGETYDDAGNEPYYISSDDSENESVRIIGARQRARQRQAHQEPHIHHHHHIHGAHSPVPSDMAEFSSVDSDVEDHWTTQPRRRRPIIVEDEDDDESDDSEGSLRDFLADEEEGRSERSSSSASNSMDEDEDEDDVDRLSNNNNSTAADEDVAPFSDVASLQSGYSENSAAIPDLTPHQRRAYQQAMLRHIQRDHRVRRPWDNDFEVDTMLDMLDEGSDDRADVPNDHVLFGERGFAMGTPQESYDTDRVFEDVESDVPGPVRSRRHVAGDSDDDNDDDDDEEEAPVRRRRRHVAGDSDDDDDNEDEDEDSEDEQPIRRVRRHR